MSAQKRYRLEEKFWLNVNNAAEQQIADIIEWLKNEHQFARAIRDGLRLIWSLRHNNSTEVLLELFPNIRERLEADCPPPPTPDGDEINRRLTSIDNKIDALAKNNISRITEDAPMVAAPPLKQLGQGIGTITSLAGGIGQGRTIAMPVLVDDPDDGDTIVLNKAASSSNGESMMASFAKLGLF